MKTLILALGVLLCPFTLQAEEAEIDPSVEELIPEEFPEDEYEKRYVKDGDAGVDSFNDENPLIEAQNNLEGKKLLRSTDVDSNDLVEDRVE